jgi:23S rRNA pseudouridine2604 synthase
LILTNIGQIHDSLLRNQVQAVWKKYLVKVDQVIEPDWIVELENGVEILGQRTKPCKIEQLDAHTFYIWLNQGLNKQIRRMCKLFNLQVIYLKRIEFGEIQLQNMQAGDCIPFTSTEIAYLKQITLRNENN